MDSLPVPETQSSRLSLFTLVNLSENLTAAGRIPVSWPPTTSTFWRVGHEGFNNLTELSITESTITAIDYAAQVWQNFPVADFVAPHIRKGDFLPLVCGFQLVYDVAQLEHRPTLTTILQVPNVATTYKQIPESRDVKGKYAFVSLGCPKNTVDSERMMGLLKLDGYQLISDPAQSDFVVVNTCGFIEQARTESFAAIDEMLELKKSGKTKGVIVSGCLAERQKEQMLVDRPEIDSLVGVFSRDEIINVADRLVGDQAEQRNIFQPAPIRALSDEDRLQITPKHFAYLKISEGCDRLCTFCAIPKMRGKHATKPMENVLAEATQLANSGVRELIIVAQDTTYYGMDLYGEPRLAELLEQLDGVMGIDWIRLMYFYPMYIDEKLINVIAKSKKILPYIDMPLQHADDTMLRRMSRRVNQEQMDTQIDLMRRLIPDLVLRTTFITGFPGETEEQFDSLVNFVDKHKFERMGVFTYSLEPDTPAAKLPDHVDEATMNDRRDRLMAVQQEIMFAHNEKQVGTTIDVIIDNPVADQPGVWVGRSKGDAPDVDGVVIVTETEHPLKMGTIVECEVVTFQGYDLIAVATGKPR